MPVKIKPLTKNELIEYFKVYRDAFPDWAVEHDVVLERTQGPIKQRIAFEALRDGAYRPSCSIEVLGTLGVRILFRFLDIKHREVLPREHVAKWTKVVKAMEEQFQPPIRRPLDLAEIVEFGEDEVARDRIENVNNFCGLAALNAYANNLERASYWCNRVQERLKIRGTRCAEWERQQAQYARALQEAIDGRQQQAFLDGMAKKQASGPNLCNYKGDANL